MIPPAGSRAAARPSIRPLLVTLLTLLVSSAGAAQTARNVIFFIGDGVDDHQLTIARNYLHGAAGSFSWDAFPGRASARVLTVAEDEPQRPVYVGDSASGGTALSAGVVTSRGRIATTASTDRDVATVLELAAAAGWKTGVVSTASVTDATPASFFAHTAVRFCEGPDDMDGSRGGKLPGCPDDLASAGGLGSISEQLVASGIDLALGGGRNKFTQKTPGGATVLEQATAADFRMVGNATELAAADELPLLGLFGGGTLPVLWIGEGGRRATGVEDNREDGAWQAPEPFACADNPAFGDRPTLVQMTDKAIELLAAASAEGEQGFFVMIESASIDKQAHAANPCGQIGETRELDDAVKVALEFAEQVPETLIVIASDHGHAGQIVPYPSLFASTMEGLHPPGKFARLRTLEGGEMAVTYGTNETFLEEHTGTTIPVFAHGPGSATFRGTIDQRQIFDLTLAAMGLKKPTATSGR